MVKWKVWQWCHKEWEGENGNESVIILFEGRIKVKHILWTVGKRETTNFFKA